ncbi:MAG TPA: hypothetical protein VFV87_09010, partial [Pirellulaceae bacterium]|nr:hypothetical protein [Pirellulaceae bacterium]
GRLQPKARLFVIASDDKFGVRAFPFTRLNSASGGIAVAAWHVGGLLYVVVIDNNNQRLEQFVREKEFALALPPAAPPA